MKIIPTTYTFDASAKTITCSDFTAIEKLAIITNLTTGTIIYQFNNIAKSGTLVGTTLTLTYDTTAMADTDNLQIIIHDTTQLAKDDTLATLQSMLLTLERIASQSPRLTRTKEVNVAMDNFGQSSTTSVVNATSNPFNGNTTLRTNEVNYFSNMGATYLYNNIK